MDKIGSYGIYQNNYYGKTQGARSENTAAAGTKSTKVSEQKSVELSSGAKKLLKELKQKYGNTDFMVADYDTDEEAAAYLSRGKSQYSVLFTPEELEKMAADKDVKEENLNKLDEAFSKLDELKDQLGEKGEEVSRLGVSMGGDGEISYFAELEKVSEKQRERIEEKREANRQERRDEQKDRIPGPGYKPDKRTTVFASSTDELAEKIGQVDWDKVPEETMPLGQRYDFTV